MDLRLTTQFFLVSFMSEKEGKNFLATYGTQKCMVKS